MSGDRLLQDLAQRVREHDRELERLDRLMSGPETAAASELEIEALKPLDPVFRRAIVDKLSGELGITAARSDRTVRRAAPGFIDSVRNALERLVAPLRTPSWTAVGFGTAVAAAVVAALTLGIFREGMEGTGTFSPYGLTLQGKALVRGEQQPNSGPVVLGTGDAFKLLLRPETAVQGPMAARAFVLEGETARPLQAPPAQVLENGVALITGTVGADVLIPEGNSQLLVVIGRPESLPDGRELARRLRGSNAVRTDDWAGWTVEVQRTP
jgi:hypothetical protein